MGTKKVQQLIIIDDDELNNFIIRQNVKIIAPLLPIFDFTDAAQGLKFICNSCFRKKTLVLLDINMPGMSGWEFIENFARLDNAIRSRHFIYIVSTSDNEQDKERLPAYPDIKKHFTKPLSTSRLKKILGL